MHIFDVASLAKEHRADLEREARLERQRRALRRQEAAPTVQPAPCGCSPGTAPAGHASAA